MPLVMLGESHEGVPVIATEAVTDPGTHEGRWRNGKSKK